MKAHLIPSRLLPAALFLAALGAPAAWAGGFKKASLWDSPIEYKLIHIENGRVTYDGLSKVGRDSVNQVILNTAFFEKEALRLWQDFEKNGHTPAGPDLKAAGLPQKLESIGLALEEGAALPRQLKEDALRELAALEREFKVMAWGSAYRKCIEGHSGAKARREFVRAFKESRLKTVEMHELSHLLDAQSRPERVQQNPREFNRRSELRAFITELKYGENPMDSLWQAMAGTRLEISRGRFIDFSLVKLLAVLNDGRMGSDPAEAMATRLYFNPANAI